MKSKRPQQKTRREKKRFKKKTLLIIISSIIIFGSFLYAMNHPYLAVETVEISGQKTIIETDIKNSVNDYLDHKILGLIPRNNVIFINTGALEQHLQGEFTKIENLRVETEGGERIVVHIGERTVHSLWCINKSYESEFDQECYFSDSFGLLYARAPYFSGNIYRKLFINPVYTTNDEGDEVESEYIGTSVSVIESFSDFFDFLNILESQFPLVTGVITFDDFGDVTIAINRLEKQLYPQEQKPVIKYNQSANYETVVRDIGIIFNFDSFRKDFTVKSTQLESIDVRFKNRAFYTFTSPALKEEE